MRSRVDLPCWQINVLPWFSQENKFVALGNVEILLVKDSCPTNEDSIWLTKSLKVAVKITDCFTRKSKGQKRRKISFPDFWKLSYQYEVSYNDFGGVTNGTFRMEVCTRIGWPVRRLCTPRAPPVLDKALSNTLVCRRPTAKPYLGQPNSYQGILE